MELGKPKILILGGGRQTTLRKAIREIINEDIEIISEEDFEPNDLAKIKDVRKGYLEPIEGKIIEEPKRYLLEKPLTGREKRTKRRKQERRNK